MVHFIFDSLFHLSYLHYVFSYLLFYNLHLLFSQNLVIVVASVRRLPYFTHSSIFCLSAVILLSLSFFFFFHFPYSAEKGDTSSCSSSSTPHCRLNADGLSAMYGALATLAVRAGNQSMFTQVMRLILLPYLIPLNLSHFYTLNLNFHLQLPVQLCIAAHTKVMESVTGSAVSSADGSKWMVEHAVAILRGLAR